MARDPIEVADAKPDRSAQRSFSATLSNLYHVLNSSDRYLFGSVNVVRRNHQDWLAVCKVTELDTMTLLVCFGAGRDYFDALKGLNGSISAGKWRPDKPWPGKGK